MADIASEHARLLKAAAAALERTQVDDSGEATMILEQVVTLDGQYVPPKEGPDDEEAARAARIEREHVAELLAQAEPVIVAIQALPDDDSDLDDDLASGWARALMEANRLLKRYPENTELQSLRTRLRRAMGTE